VIMERLRSAVAAAEWTDLQIPAPVTVSIGVATAPAVPEGEPGAIVGWRALFDTADLHLFSAKRGGRNRVRAHGPTTPADSSDRADADDAAAGEAEE
jgi:GGDEF domain-containing protein